MPSQVQQPKNINYNQVSRVKLNCTQTYVYEYYKTGHQMCNSHYHILNDELLCLCFFILWRNETVRNSSLARWKPLRSPKHTGKYNKPIRHCYQQDHYCRHLINKCGQFPIVRPHWPSAWMLAARVVSQEEVAGGQNVKIESHQAITPVGQVVKIIWPINCRNNHHINCRCKLSPTSVESQASLRALERCKMLLICLPN